MHDYGMTEAHQVPQQCGDHPVTAHPRLPRHRLRLTGHRAPAEHIDGAWWPASRQLDVELPHLIAAIEDRLPAVVLVAYSRQGWIAPSHRIDRGDRPPVELVSFDSDEPPVVIAIGEDGHHLTLRVIDPDTDQHEAESALDEIPRRALVSQQANTPSARSVADVAKKLADHEGLNRPDRDTQILDWCREAAERFDDARIQTFVPILVEHIVNNRIHSEHQRDHAARLAEH